MIKDEDCATETGLEGISGEGDLVSSGRILHTPFVLRVLSTILVRISMGSFFMSLNLPPASLTVEATHTVNENI